LLAAGGLLALGSLLVWFASSLPPPRSKEKALAATL
jgi:hypothetical protein